MRSSARLAAQANNHGSPSPAHRPAKSLEKSGALLTDLIREIEREWNLGLDITDEKRSPDKAIDDLPNRVRNKIKVLYWRAKPVLDENLAEFRRLAPKRTQSGRLKLLDGLLPQPADTPTPNRTKVLPTPEASGIPDGPSLLPRSSPTRRLEFVSPSSTDKTYRTAVDTGSSTEEDEDFITPPSPSVSIRSAQRRSQASPRFSLGPATRKRPSDYVNDNRSSPKLTKTVKGKQPSTHQSPTRPIGQHNPNNVSPFKKPVPSMAPSFQAASKQDSANTSFNTTWSSQPQPGTDATSFSSEVGDVPMDKSRALTSSTTINSLDERDMNEVSLRLEQDPFPRQGHLTRASTSTFGSIDEGAVAEIADQYQEAGISRDVRASVNRSSSRLQKGEPPATTPSKNVSPPKMSHTVRSIPTQHLFVQDTPEHLRWTPYFIQFIFLRLTIERNMKERRIKSSLKLSMSDTMAGINSTTWASHDTLHNYLQTHPVNPVENSHEAMNLWDGVKKNFEGFTFKGRVVFSNRRKSEQGNSEPVFELQLSPIQADKSCRFQRAFGADRFLYLTFPSFDGKSETRFTKDELVQVEGQWREWCLTTHSFLGRRWRAFHFERIKRPKPGRGNDTSIQDKRVVLFATDGYDIPNTIPIGTLMNWFFHFPDKDNQNQPFPKAYARFDLGLSRTSPTYVFKPSQVKYYPDAYSDDTPEDERFNDSNFTWPTVEKAQVMNDGCSVLSMRAAQEIWRVYKGATGTNDPMPSAFQGRIGGAKGLWVVNAEYSSNNHDHQDIWIKISESQLKFEPHREDLDDSQYNRHRLTFELVNYSSAPAPSDLHISFIPIMVDRGVPIKDIANIMTERLDIERQTLLEILPDPVKMYDWHYKQGPRTRDDNIPWQAALPHALDEKVRLLLESGFSPLRAPYLTRCLSRFIDRQQIMREKKLRAPLGKATYLYGVADPLGVLAPGEVHVQFSSSFTDHFTYDQFRCLNNIDLLVARQPACRRSDIQKVRAVVNPRLSHLVDVVVFPSKGQYPLAGKLQGGDYDGDIFWLCWEPKLVAPFLNAPAPVQSPDPSQYGIEKEQRKVNEVMRVSNLASVDSFLDAVLRFQMKPCPLGMVTFFADKQAYRENRVWSETLDHLYDIHDLLVDAPKQGYIYSDNDFNRYVSKHLRLPVFLPRPAYKKAMEACENAKEMGEAEKARIDDYGFMENNVLDFLYFKVMREHNRETLRLVSEAFANPELDEPRLQYPIDRIKNRLGEKPNKAVEDELNRLTQSLTEINMRWNRDMVKGRKPNQYNTTVENCYREYRNLTPSQRYHPDIKPWLEPYLDEEFSIWDSLKASALYMAFPRIEKQPFIFHLAGRELCNLKAGRHARSMVQGIYVNTKPKPVRWPTQIDTGNTDDLDEDDELQTAMDAPVDIKIGLGLD
ncbi:RNA dependent RNA polymerase-domain-containing protein [Dendryphion nanum]|uniref:RNA-dependent RNA polymerase n=1 Tax=Dendryphion nanum TaxID=256645 RepID=A0A9P9E1N5_9PLEO|nr:RNA dependent RNA polymerase-domain-containing protein [Dendryphion nanum]